MSKLWYFPTATPLPPAAFCSFINQSSAAALFLLVVSKALSVFFFFISGMDLKLVCPRVHLILGKREKSRGAESDEFKGVKMVLFTTPTGS